ncbi:hypothetical protein UFOVP597_10 [uncultured Caudovirales phage]|uniref:Uncharacterized protein n=1 Tax=uncultured Caudovirales phage TaxID=2100421 RepID=A0A6J5N230_9CAUD|nr:hypothetical protein UFOVP597_10 [uncultured Caudovirales phage]
MATNTDILKRKMIEALEKSLGIVTTAIKSLEKTEFKLHRSTHYDWLHSDENYKKEVESIQEITLDFAESQLHKQINEGNTSATIFYLKTKGKKRGYIERQDIAFIGDEIDFSDISDEDLQKFLNKENE